MSQAIPSPIATGGAGGRFEERVGAYALALLLTQSRAPVFIEATVSTVHLQARHLGWRTDDVVLEGEDSLGIVRKLAIQAKRTFTIAPADEDCVETFEHMWDDFHAAGRFDRSRDRLAVATLQGTSTLLGSFNSLLDCARASKDAADFQHRLTLAGYISQKAKTQNDALLSIIEKYTNNSVAPEEYWRFLTVLHVLSFDFGTSTASGDALIMSLLAHLVQGAGDATAHAAQVWLSLVELSSDGRQMAKSFTRSGLPESLLSMVSGLSTTDERHRRALVTHGHTVRNAIYSTVGPNYSMDRTGRATELIECTESNKIVLITGEAGSGKSALVKASLDIGESSRHVLAFQAVEFAKAHLAETLATVQANLSAQVFNALFASDDRVLVLIDGVERLLESPTRDAFTQMLQLVASSPSLRLLLTCRDYSVETVRSAFLERAGAAHSVFKLESVSDNELGHIAHAVPTLKPVLEDATMRSLLRTPYLLNLAARIDWRCGSLPSSLRAFRSRCWSDFIRDDSVLADALPIRRESTFIAIAVQRASELRPYVRPVHPDTLALQRLRGASLLESPPNSAHLFAPAHDVLEDWAIMKWLDDLASTADDPALELVNAVNALPALRRGLRRWLGEELMERPEHTRELILTILGRIDLPQYFRDDCTVAALQSSTATQFIANSLAGSRNVDLSLLRQFVHLLRVSCKSTPPGIGNSEVLSTLLLPTGSAWEAMLEAIAQTIEYFSELEFGLLIGLLEDWSLQVDVETPSPPGADAAGTILTRLLEYFDHPGGADLSEPVLKLILKIPKHVPAFHPLVNRAQSRQSTDFVARKLVDLICAGAIAVSRDFPEVVFNVMREELLMRKSGLARYRRSGIGTDEHFGIIDRGVTDYFPASEYQGPFRILLMFHFRSGIDFIVELLNHSGEWYGQRVVPGLEPAQPVVIEFADGSAHTQWFNPRLYFLFRGLSVGPYVLQCALMALEACLLRFARYDWFDIDACLSEILRRSNSVMATGVIASVCMAHPERTPITSIALLSSRSLIDADRDRMGSERNSSSEFLTGVNPSHQFYESERRRANKLPHRSKDLEALARDLQATSARELVWAAIDRHRNRIGSANDEHTLAWKLALYRMDVRAYREVEGPPRPEISLASGQRIIYVAPHIPEPEVLALVERGQADLAAHERFAQLYNTALRLWKGEADHSIIDWEALVTEAVKIADNGFAPSYFRDGPGFLAATCIRDRCDELEHEDRMWCIELVVTELLKFTKDETYDPHSAMLSADQVAGFVIPIVFDRFPQLLNGRELELLAIALTHPSSHVRNFVHYGCREYFGTSNPEMLIRVASAIVARAAVLTTTRSEVERVGRFGSRRPDDVGPRVRAAVSKALAADSKTASTQIISLAFEESEARRAARRVGLVLEMSNSPIAVEFFTNVARWLAQVWSTKRLGGVGRDYDVEYDLSSRLARFALRQSVDTALAIIDPLLPVVARQPTEVERFVHDLVIAADGRTDDAFWHIWQSFADVAVRAPWVPLLDRERDSRGRLLDRLFLSAEWKPGVTHWSRLTDEDGRIHRFAAQLPASVPAIESYVQFLFTVGRQSVPKAFEIVDDLVHRSSDAVRILSNRSISFGLESILRPSVYGEPARLKHHLPTRNAVLRLLDTLTLAGSAAAFRMRDDFVTPMRI